MINNVGSIGSQISRVQGGANPQQKFSESIKALSEGVSKIDETQKTADVSIKDLLAGKNEDITSVVSDVAKADMSFKLLVGVRNKLIEAYQQTMNMQI